MELVHLKFEPRFAPLIQDGRKTQTMRRYEAGERLPELGDLAVCIFQANRHQVHWLGNYLLDEVLPVRIDIHRMAIQVAGFRMMASKDREQFAIDDGFTCVADMQQWFRQRYPDLLIYEGWILGWTFSQGPFDDDQN